MLSLYYFMQNYNTFCPNADISVPMPISICYLPKIVIFYLKINKYGLDFNTQF